MNPGPADTATVGWLDDKNTINQMMTNKPNSNYGPRSSDDDSESWDEMKPWVVARDQHQLCTTCRILWNHP